MILVAVIACLNYLEDQLYISSLSIHTTIKQYIYTYHFNSSTGFKCIHLSSRRLYTI